ncbi:MAG: HAMP domain-containing protein [Anaerolineae bacterium]|nr:HAMP domain-containing protein [Anaerolineae bacterium]
MTQTLTASPPEARRLPLRFLGGVLLALGLAIMAFVLLMRPPSEEIRAMALFLSITALVSVAAGYGAYRLGWISRSPRLVWSLLAGYILATLLTFLNVGFSARLMFASPHDLTLAAVLLLFAGGIAVALGYFISSTLTERIGRVASAAAAVAEGDLTVRIPVSGNDEIADLSRAFNEMAGRLQEADRKQRELEQLRRDLVAWAGHDLRTPLASTRVMIDALADGLVDDPATASRYLQTSQRDIKTLSLLIDDLFNLAQMDAGGLKLERRPTAISDLISDTLESFAALAAQRDVTLGGQVETGIDPVLGDGQQIARVLSNLVSNALRHTPSGGEVQVSATRAGQWVTVQVADSGEGIAAVDLPHVFDRFYRGEKSRSRATGGSGLGLAIAHSIVEAHSGRIWVESEQGHGACFFFTLPASA